MISTGIPSIRLIPLLKNGINVFFFFTINVVRTSNLNVHKRFCWYHIFHLRKETIPNNVIFINSGQNENIPFSRTSVVVPTATSITIARPSRFDLPKCILCEVWRQQNYTYVNACTATYFVLVIVLCAVDDQQPAVVAARDSRPFENNTPLFYTRLWMWPT